MVNGRLAYRNTPPRSLSTTILGIMYVADTTFGQGKWDTIFSGVGSDLLFGRPSVDMVHAGEGDDRVYAWDDRDRDLVECGPGTTRSTSLARNTPWAA